MGPRKKLGGILVRHFGIPKDVVVSAIKARDGRLGESLVRHGHLTEHERIEALALQLQIPTVGGLVRAQVSPEVVERIPFWMASRYRVMPVSTTGGGLVIAMVDPTDEETLRALETHLGVKVYAAITTEAEIHEALLVYYHGVAPEHAARIARMHRTAAVIPEDPDIAVSTIA